MVKAQQNMKVISKHNAEFPDYLDFEKLRSAGIEYLGKLSGKIWTDHNVHDPGITILEVLCYALLDLGYRTSLPAADIFSNDPAAAEKEDNFFTPAQILACNPLTIIDYRKMLIDIDGVKNAWLEVASDQTDFCKPQSDPLNRRATTNDCNEYLNGLYHVYIEPEKNVATDFNTEAEANAHLDELYSKVKAALLGSRNLCEDFVDIYMLCKLQMGVCADIALDAAADVEKTYVSIAERLRAFLSPAPRFYTLQQLLDKDKPIEEIFAGRPYDVAQSHGFIDTEELMQLQLKKEIHLSDVYHIILETEGVQSVNNLGLRKCKDNNMATNSGWKFPLPENHVPDFSMECSGFKFSRNGLPVEIDTKKYEGLLNINFSQNNKTLYASPSAFLDHEIPKGVYHKELDEYFLLQNDFPKVYGIAEGGLAQNVGKLRKAQALQLKGYLLFFDELLSGYLAQLKNIRSLFSMSASAEKDKRHTYFLNTLETLPELSPLFRFGVGADGHNSLGKEEDVLVRPVPRLELDEMIASNLAAAVDLHGLSTFNFPSLADQEIAINALKDDFYNGSITCGFLNENSTSVSYYIFSSAANFALISKKYFKTVPEANLHANAVGYLGTFDENYNTYIVSPDSVSFNIGLNIASVKAYLEEIVEDKALYAQRRNSFLDHLLSRFAERFTDFALFSYGKALSGEALASGIQAKELFLSKYDELSANRAKAYDYLESKWKNNNHSGFENEAKYLSGIAHKERRNLCNFVVEQYDDQYLVDLKIAGQSFFKLEEKFDSRLEALDAARNLVEALADPAKIKVQYIAHEKSYAVQVQYTDRQTAFFNEKYESAEAAEAVKNNLQNMFSPAGFEEHVFINSYRYVIQLIDHEGKVVRESVDSLEIEAEAAEKGLSIVYKPNDDTLWRIINDSIAKIGTLYWNKSSKNPLNFIDVQSFKIDINNSIVGRPDKFSYDVLDSTNHFKFYAEKEFKTSKEARQHCWLVLGLASDAANYQLSSKTDGKTKISITNKNEAEASCYVEFSTEQDALNMMQEIISLIKKRAYTLKTEPVPNDWKFNFQLGYKPESVFLFTSSQAYPKQEDTIQALKVFYDAIPALQLQFNPENTVLAPPKANEVVPTVLMSGTEENAAIANEALPRALEQQIAIIQLANNREALSEAVIIDDSNGKNKFVYRLVDKDNIIAFYQESFPGKERANFGRIKVARTLRDNLKYLQLCLGGDIVRQIERGKANLSRYHYQLKAHNKRYHTGGATGQEIVLFESVTAYSSVEAALQAFEENYLQILGLAEDESNYGSLIALETIDHAGKSSAIVFIPANTLAEFSGSGAGSIPKEMAALVKTYPIKQVLYGSESFNQLFCAHTPPATTDPCISGVKPMLVYYFATHDHQKEQGKWQSVNYYETAAEAMQDFIFFVALLKYAGNLYVDCDLCDDNKTSTYRIYLREVLAESAERFPDEASAWGKAGLQKFICAVQSDFGFQNFQRSDDCCYSFYINCGQELVVHPCHYNTAKKRNAVLNEIFLQFNSAMERKSYGSLDDGNQLLLLDDTGKPFAEVSSAEKRKGSCETLMDIIEQINDASSSYEQEGEDLYLKDKSGKVLLHSFNKNSELRLWQNMLKSFVYYHPVFKTRNQQTGKISYGLALKFPAFNPMLMEEELRPCGCENEKAESEPACYVAWNSSCNYDSCDEAMKALAQVQELLTNFENYQPIVDCTCNNFGIGLLSNRIAFNPQCYESAQMVCSAVARSKALTNAEGLHVAEHILLRPRCPGDCDCRRDLICGENKRHCNYTWLPPNDDPCNQARDICFIPGSDPYSFIATVALPAWPLRFRTAAGRKAMEDVLYRLAPAHVLLRILWLAPHDFCCFESKYHGWRRWLAKKKTCNNNFSVCDFLDFLFNRNFECLDDCKSCLPCENDAVLDPFPCFYQELNQVKTDQNQFLNQVNESFCWQQVDCEKYAFSPCEIVKSTDDQVNKPRTASQKSGTGSKKISTKNALKALIKDKKKHED